jgi:hypothetical protein
VLGWLCALSGLFTLAGGVLTPATLILVALLRMRREPSDWRRESINVAAGIALVALGAAIASPPLVHHAPLRAASVLDFLTTLALGLAWPWSRVPAIGMSVWLPLLAVAVAALRRDVHLSATERFAGVLAPWVLLQAAALAYGRGAHGPPPISRYMDLLSWTVLVNGIAFLGLVQREGSRRLGMQAAFAVWIAIQTVGVVRVSRAELDHLGPRQPWSRAHLQNVARFMVTGDVAWFRTLPAPDQSPYPDAAILANGWLRHPYIRGIMPSGVREPLRIAPGPGVAPVFVRGGVPGGLPVDPLRVAWGSFTAEGAAARGRFESRPLASCVMRKRLRIEVAGDQSGGGVRLALKSLSGGEFPVPLPGRLTNGWHAVTVPCPPGPFSIVADDASGDGWLAFREPVEIGSVSARIETLIRHSRIVQNLAAGLMLIAAALSFWVYAGRHRGRPLPAGGVTPIDTAPSAPGAATAV